MPCYLSQEVLALKAEIDRTYVSGLERSIRNLSVDVLEKLVAMLSIKTIEFFKENRRNPAPALLPRGRRQKRKENGEKSEEKSGK